MHSADPFGKTNKLDEATLEALVKRFEARGRHPQFSKMLGEYLDVMHIDQAAKVLDMGCGTGLAARAIARHAGFSGRVIGVDLSPHLVAAAKRLAGDEGLAEYTEFKTGDIRHLDFADGTFDAIVAHTLVSHIENPLSVVQEAARLLKPGGMLGIFDGDYASLTFGYVDPAKGKAYDEALVSAVVTNPRVMRQMPRMLAEADLELVTFFPYVLSEAGTSVFWSSAIEVYRRLIPEAGMMTEDEADTWAASLQHDSEAGIFFGSSNYYVYVARCI